MRRVAPRTWWAESPAAAGGVGLLHIGLLVLFFQSFSIVRSAVTGSASSAYAHGRAVLRLEAALHLPAEQRVQSVILGHPSWCTAANVYYGAVHFVVPAVIFAVLYRCARWRYRSAVVAFVIISFTGLVAFAVWPTMPPRLLPGSFGFVDVGARFAGLPVDQALASGPGNGFAAMPSLHAAYALWSVWALWPVLPTRWRRVAVLYPVVTTLVVVATANHYWLDVIAGALLAAVVTGAVSRRHHGQLHLASPLVRERLRFVAVAGLACTSVFFARGGHAANAVAAATLVFVLAVTLERRRAPVPTDPPVATGTVSGTGRTALVTTSPPASR